MHFLSFQGHFQAIIFFNKLRGGSQTLVVRSLFFIISVFPKGGRGEGGKGPTIKEEITCVTSFLIFCPDD